MHLSQLRRPDRLVMCRSGCHTPCELIRVYGMTYGRSRYAVAPCKGSLCNAAAHELIADADTLTKGQLGVRMGSSAAPTISTTLAYRIPSVVKLCTNKQVVRVKARGIVAAVTNQHAFGDRTVPCLESNPWNVPHALADLHLATPSFVPIPGPIPANGRIMLGKLHKLFFGHGAKITYTRASALYVAAFPLDHSNYDQGVACL